ncbi:MBL fold metallo-hydrolase [Patescibacteria group bacterium]
MQITLLSEFCFKIKVKKINLLIGEFSKKFSKVNADIIVCPNLNGDLSLQRVEGEPFIVSAPGEYEISNISVFGSKKFYIIEIGDVKLCYLYQLDSTLTENQLEEIGSIDVLFVPLGDKHLKVDLAFKLIGQIQPSIVIPADRDEIKSLLQKMGFENQQKVNKYKFSKSDLPEEMEVVILQERNNGSIKSSSS